MTPQFFLSAQAVLVCLHEIGLVGLVATQDLVSVENVPILVEDNPENRPIVGCPNTGVGIKPCLQTLKVKQGYSEWISISGKPVCLDSVKGLTDGTPPGFVEYKVRSPGQSLISEVQK